MANKSDFSERRAFDETKAGVKGLVDAGVKKIPTLFHHQPDKFDKATNLGNHVIPVIDLANIDKGPSLRQDIVHMLREASETWGFFQVVNHGTPLSVLEEIKNGVKRFFEQDAEVIKEFYTRDKFKSFIYNSNFDLYSSPALNWRDSFACYLAPDAPKPEHLPLVCRDILLEYGKHMMNLGTLLLELFSEALGLDPGHLKDMGCTEGLIALCHYYPACPEPELTVGTTKHSDNDFLTVLLQDHIGGLQVLYQDQWIDVTPVPGALVVNVGDLLQLITNDRFKSVEHQVLANHVGPRISVACFFSTEKPQFLTIQPTTRRKDWMVPLLLHITRFDIDRRKMGTNATNEMAGANKPDFSERKAFDETKAGVKGLVDAGVKKIPTFFHHQHDKFEQASNSGDHVVPVIDLANIDKDPSLRQEVVNQLREASETWGFFQIVNHGIPLSVLEEIKDGVQRFYEQDTEVTKEFYTRERYKSFIYNSNFDIYSSPALNWRDTFLCYLAPDPPKPEDLPQVCRDILLEYGKHIMNLGTLLFELFSEALGLNPNHLKDMGCLEGLYALCHYYPACPEPELTLGTTKHSDNDFLTVLLQDHIGGLQVRYQDKWIDVTPVPGALVVNVGDFLQLITNDRFKSVEHQVLANHAGPRISVACFFSTAFRLPSKLYGPIKELLSKDNPAKYRETTIAEYVAYYVKKGLDGTSALSHYRI